MCSPNDIAFLEQKPVGFERVQRLSLTTKAMRMIRHGDLVFSYVGNEGNPISAVTEGYKGARVNHVGVAVINGKGTFILEAFPPEVRLTNVVVFSNRSNDTDGHPRLMFGRVQPSYEHLLPDAIAYGLSKRDIPYDQLYLDNEKALYCSELVVDMFKVANGGTLFFPENPMDFKDSTTGKTSEVWVEYYARFGMVVPEGQPGSNPGDLSRDPKLQIYTIIGSIPGYQQTNRETLTRPI